MRAVYLDCFSGISGDMTIGALIDAGADKELLLRELAKLNIGGYEIEIKPTAKNGIMGTDFNVILTNDHAHAHQHSHEHSHDDSRNFEEIKFIINASNLSPNVKDKAIKIFYEIANAEAIVHGKPLNQVHFHEVGAVDSIVDIVGTAICLDLLQIDVVYCSVLHDGCGTIKCAHGEIPVPVPAVMQMLKDSAIPLVVEDIKAELITPTGMAIVKTLSKCFGPMPCMDIKAIGYGFGKRETGKLNALRVIVGQIKTSISMDEISVLETNIDNVNPEIVGYTVDKLFEKGALDVYQTSIQMKKNRSGTLLAVMCKPEDEQSLAHIILKETSTLGVRRSSVERYILPRKHFEVSTQWGTAKVKVVGEGDLMKFSPEFEDCKLLAEKNNIPLKDIYQDVYFVAKQVAGEMGFGEY